VLAAPASLVLLDARNPYPGGSGVAGRNLPIMTAQGTAGPLIAARSFRWTPQSS
jgi:hypothetical protein